MSEEEAIGICKNIIRAINGDTCYINYSKEQDKEAIETLLDLYNKQKEEIEELKKPKYIMNFETGSVTKIDNDFISKDKIREFIKEELPDDEIMKCCERYDINGIYIREKLEKLL